MRFHPNSGSSSSGLNWSIFCKGSIQVLCARHSFKCISFMLRNVIAFYISISITNTPLGARNNTIFRFAFKSFNEHVYLASCSQAGSNLIRVSSPYRSLLPTALLRRRILSSSIRNFASGMKLSAVLLLALIMYVFALAAEGKPAPGRGRPVLPSKRLGQMAAYR